MSVWSVWSPCSCETLRQQRYRVALSPATRGQQCTPVETQSRVCEHSNCAGELLQEMKLCKRLTFVFTDDPMSDEVVAFTLHGLTAG